MLKFGFYQSYQGYAPAGTFWSPLLVVILLFSVLMSPSPVQAEEQEKRYLVVLDLQNENSDLSDSELNYFSEVMRNNTGKYCAGFLQMDKDNIKVILEGFGREFAKCADGTCVVDIGRRLKADVVASGTVYKLPAGYRIILTLHEMKDARRLKTLEVTSVTRDGIEEALKANVGELYAPLAKYGPGGALNPGIVINGAILYDLDSYTPEVFDNKITDQKGFLIVETDPPGATVSIEGVERGAAPFGDEFMVGRYVVDARLDDYYHISRELVQLTEKGARVSLKMVPAFGTLKVESRPSEADVLINDKSVGKTPFADERFKSGQYRIEVRKGQYKTQSRDIQVSDGKIVSEVFELKADFGNLEVRSEPSGAMVWVDGKEVGRTPQLVKKLTTGDHSVRVVLDFYEPWTAVVAVEGEVTSTNTAKLKPDFGAIRLTTDPAGATVSLDGKDTKKVTPVDLSPIKAGTHMLTLDKEGYGRASQKVVVEKGRVAEISVGMTAKLGMLSVMSQYSDGTLCEGDLKIDGGSVGKTPWKGNVVAVSHVVEVQCGAGHATETVEVKHNQSKSLKMKVNVAGAPAVAKTVNAKDSKNKILPAKDVKAVRRISPWPWVTFGVGAAAIVTGGVLNVYADVDMNAAAGQDVTQAQAAAYVADSNTKNNAAIGMYAIGGAAVVAGLIWGIVDAVKVHKARAKSGARAAVSGLLLQGGGGIGIAGAF